MASFVIDEISHFIGLMKLDALLNLDPYRYEGAPVYRPDPIAFDPPFIPSADLLPPVKAPLPLAPIDFPLFPLRNYNFEVGTPPISLPDFFPRPHRLDLPQPKPFEIELPDPLLSFVVRGVAPPDLFVNLNYTYGSSQYLIAKIAQSNVLYDNDTVAAVHELLDELLAQLRAGADDAAQAALLAQFADLAGALPTYAGKLAEFSDLDGYDQQSIELSATQQGPFPDLSAGQAAQTDLREVDGGNGTFVNGELTSHEGQSASQQSRDANAQLNRLEPDGEDSLLEAILGPVDDSADGVSSSVATTDAPDGVGDISVTTGENTATNLALINDIHGADGSRIILGDFHEIDAIVQLNFYTQVSVTDALFDFETPGIVFAGSNPNAASGGSGTEHASLINEASFQHVEAVAGQPLDGFGPGVFDWNVDYVYGNYYDVTVVEQRNFIDDSDTIQTHTIKTQYTAESGDNDQLNITEYSDFGYGYDLIIVAGDWVESNVIIQTNFLLDDALWSDEAGASNSLVNDAAIVSSGGASHNEITQTAQDLAHAIATHDETFNYDLAIGLLENGDGEFNVLYVSGDYLASNIVLQTNIAIDVDTAVHLELPGEANSSGATHGNDLANIALINDVDSVLDYQFLGGEAYEEAVLFQANIVGEEDVEWDDLAEGEIHPDVIATIAAMAGATTQDVPEETPGQAYDVYSQGDGLCAMTA